MLAYWTSQQMRSYGKGASDRFAPLKFISDPRDAVWMDRNFSMSNKNIEEGRHYVVITHAFRHASVFHFGANMLGLWSFGRSLMHAIAPSSFLILYFGGVLVRGALEIAERRRLARRRPTTTTNDVSELIKGAVAPALAFSPS